VLPALGGLPGQAGMPELKRALNDKNVLFDAVLKIVVYLDAFK
jgi:hypothetical protein